MDQKNMIFEILFCKRSHDLSNVSFLKDKGGKCKNGKYNMNLI